MYMSLDLISFENLADAISVECFKEENVTYFNISFRVISTWATWTSGLGIAAVRLGLTRRGLSGHFFLFSIMLVSWFFNACEYLYLCPQYSHLQVQCPLRCHSYSHFVANNIYYYETKFLSEVFKINFYLWYKCSNLIVTYNKRIYELRD